MFVAYVVVGAVLSLMLVASGAMKLMRAKPVADNLQKLGVPLSVFPLLAIAEIAGAAGLLAGLVFGPFGIAAACGVTLYFLGAIVTHVRKADWKGLGAPIFLLGLAIAAGALRFAA